MQPYEFAGLTFPKPIYLLPRREPGQSILDCLRKRRDSRKICGPYTTNPTPNAKPISFFYLNSDFQLGLRWDWCDEIAQSIRHTGWFCDESQLEKVRGIVARLPHGRGFLAGWSMGEGMASELDGRRIWENERDAAHAADDLARWIAEDEMEQSQKEAED